MLAIDKKVEERSGTGPEGLLDDVLASSEPLVFKDLVADWPVVEAGKRSADAAIGYIRDFYQGATVGAFFGDAQFGGRIFYNDDMTGFNYRRAMLKLDEILDEIREHAGKAEPPAVYLGSTTVDTCLPGFRNDNDIDFGDIVPLVSIWLGNRTRIAAHYDFPDNLACNVAGHRRFTLFPPEEIENLYPGPLDFTPAGQTISLVDFHDPDFDRFPRFEKALESALTAELEPGDAVFVPSMWWHHVEALDDLNVLINYWWRQSPAFMGIPADALMHALLTIRDLPDEQRRVWRRLFDYYVFDADEDTVRHIPEHSRGILAPIDDRKAREMRSQLLNKLNR